MITFDAIPIGFSCKFRKESVSWLFVEGTYDHLNFNCTFEARLFVYMMNKEVRSSLH